MNSTRRAVFSKTGQYRSKWRLYVDKAVHTESSQIYSAALGTKVTSLTEDVGVADAVEEGGA